MNGLEWIPDGIGVTRKKAMADLQKAIDRGDNVHVLVRGEDGMLHPKPAPKETGCEFCCVVACSNCGMVNCADRVCERK